MAALARPIPLSRYLLRADLGPVRTLELAAQERVAGVQLDSLTVFAKQAVPTLQQTLFLEDGGMLGWTLDFALR